MYINKKTIPLHQNRNTHYGNVRYDYIKTIILWSSTIEKRNCNFWDKKGEYEIDIILVNDQDKLLRIGEIKRQAKIIEQYVLQEKAEYFLSLYPQLVSYKQELLTLSMEDIWLDK